MVCLRLKFLEGEGRGGGGGQRWWGRAGVVNRVDG